jgi:hypothetical protein
MRNRSKNGFWSGGHAAWWRALRVENDMSTGRIVAYDQAFR